MPIIKAKALKTEVAEVLNENSITNTDITMIFSQKRTKETENFAMILQKTMKYYVCSLSGTGMKLMMYFISSMFYGNFVEVDQREIMDKLKIGRTALNKAMGELKELGVIAIIPDLNDKRRNTYMLNHYATWKGNAGDRQKSIKKNKEIFPNPNQLQLPFSTTETE
jgi:DNA-binding MarR family transcriptional regulator